MALESASFVSQLNSANPLSTDTVSQADDHLRLIKKVLVDTFPNLSSPVTATASQLNSPVPAGFIGMWSGAIGAIPSGWALCNGSNGTPDLRDRFIVGAGSTYAIGNTGGANSVTLTEAQIPSHTHTISSVGVTNTVGAHTHVISDPGHTHLSNAVGLVNGTINWVGTGGTPYNNGNNTQTASATTGITNQTAGDHAHSLNITSAAATAGGGGSHENRPPYFALAYIMKL
jgi:microcystin-dependent protein